MYVLVLICYIKVGSGSEKQSIYDYVNTYIILGYDLKEKVWIYSLEWVFVFCYVTIDYQMKVAKSKLKKADKLQKTLKDKKDDESDHITKKNLPLDKKENTYKSVKNTD